MLLISIPIALLDAVLNGLLLQMSLLQVWCWPIQG
jgi:hypothetical protein